MRLWHAALLLSLVVCQPAAPAAEPLQPWVKKGRVLEPGVAGEKSTDRLSAPCVVRLKNGRLRLYFWTVGKGKHYIFAAEADPEAPTRWRLVRDEPLLAPDPGSKVLDGGPSFPWVLPRTDGPWLMYFCAWGSWAPPGELSNRTCLATSDDEGLTWKVAQAPLLPLGPKGSFDGGLTGSACVLRPAAKDYRMWYTAGERYEKIEGVNRGIVHIGYATSPDGVSWKRHPEPLLSPRLDKVKPYEAVVSKPSVVVLDGVYHMWLSVFSMEKKGYRLGYARSRDGIRWERALDQEILPLAPDGFDSANQSYPQVIEVGDELWMFYAGNQFGATGIGLATMKKSALQ